MSDTLKQYGGWILSGLLIGVILYLIFRPVPVIDNSAEIKTIDSLKVIVKAKDDALVDISYRANIEIGTLKNDLGLLLAKNDVLKFRFDVNYDEKLSLANQVKYYEAHKDTAAFDSACDLLATKVINDSVTLKEYEINTDKLIANFSQGIEDRDSLITFQSNLIVSQKDLIKEQSKLNSTQSGQLVTITRRAKLNGTLAKIGAIAVGILAIVVATK